MNSKHMLFALLGSLLFAVPGHAASLLITNGTVFTGDDAPLSQLDILIEDGLIQAVASDLNAAEADHVIDAAGRPVTPALFAGITAVGLSEIGMVYEAVDSRLKGLYTGLMHPEFDVRKAYNPLSSVVPSLASRIWVHASRCCLWRSHDFRPGLSGALRRGL